MRFTRGSWVREFQERAIKIFGVFLYNQSALENAHYFRFKEKKKKKSGYYYYKDQVTLTMDAVQGQMLNVYFLRLNRFPFNKIGSFL